MSDVQMSEPNPYEFYQSGQPLDINSPEARSELAMNPLGDDRGQEIQVGRIGPEQLENMAKESEGSVFSRSSHQQEIIREVLHRRGISTPPVNGRKYFT